MKTKIDQIFNFQNRLKKETLLTLKGGVVTECCTCYAEDYMINLGRMAAQSQSECQSACTYAWEPPYWGVQGIWSSC